jgi:Uma2 family endonuclease
MSALHNERPPKRPATMADLEALPDNVKGEIIDGVLYTQPRPLPRHARVEYLLGGKLLDPFDHGRGGPGGWWILPEPGITLPGSPEFSPDLAGWRHNRLPVLPEDRNIDVAPDWICEILSPSTRGYDQRIKRPFYARIGVGYLWYVDLESHSLTVSQLQPREPGGLWVDLGVYREDDVIRAAPFDAIEIALGEWWQTGAPPPGSATP